MVRVFIVDDEMMFRIGVKSCIHWDEYGCELVGEAADGKQALEMISELQPDLVFTDIKMPVMDGLELTRNIADHFPEVKVIILSCYNDFEYVKEALKLGARDYIHKLSLKPSDLTDLVCKMKDVIEEEKRLKQQVTMLQQEFLTNINRMKENFLRDAIADSGKVDECLFQQKVGYLGLRISYDHNSVVVLSIDDYGNVVRPAKDRSLFNSAFSNMANDIVNAKLAGEVIAWEPNIFVMIVSLPSVNQHERLKVITKLVKEMNTAAQKFFNCSISAGISLTNGNFKEAGRMFEEGLVALTGRFYQGKEFIGVFNSDRRYDYKPFKIEIGVENQLQNAIEISDADTAAKIVAEISQALRNESNLHPSVVRNNFKEFIFIFNRAARSFGGDIAEFSNENPFEVIDRLVVMADIEDWIQDFSRQMVQFIADLKSSRYRNEVVRVLNYLKNDISRNVSLKEAAQIANMSEKYFCLVFKKETGRNYVDYVSDVKVEAAKTMLHNPEIKAYEVAFKLGFENESYFSKIFKKYTGFTPNEFRKNLQH